MLYRIWDGVSKDHHHPGVSCRDLRFSSRSWRTDGIGLVDWGMEGDIPGMISYITMDGQIGNGVFRESWGWGPVGRAEHRCSEKL